MFTNRIGVQYAKQYALEIETYDGLPYNCSAIDAAGTMYYQSCFQYL